MQSVLLIDNLFCNHVQASHNKKYAEALLDIPGTEIYEDYYEFKHYTKHHYLRGLLERNNYIKKIDTKGKICHFLVLDFFYRYPLVFISLKRKGIRIIATLHHVPESNNAIRMLKVTSRYLDEIVVHSEYLRDRLSAIGITNVTSIDYPVFIDKNLHFSNIPLPDDKIKIVCLGGTRFDKGADIAICAAGKLEAEDKKKVVIVFSGKEEDIKYSDIRKIAKENAVNIVIDNRVLPETDYWGYINKADSIFIPYRREFSGASGPMTDGVFFEKTIIGPSNGNLGDTITKNEIGYTFEPENIDDIANILHVFLNGKFTYSKKAQEYRKLISVNSFLDKYSMLYKKIRDKNN